MVNCKGDLIEITYLEQKTLPEIADKFEKVSISSIKQSIKDDKTCKTIYSIQEASLIDDGLVQWTPLS